MCLPRYNWLPNRVKKKTFNHTLGENNKSQTPNPKQVPNSKAGDTIDRPNSNGESPEVSPKQAAKPVTSTAKLPDLNAIKNKVAAETSVVPEEVAVAEAKRSESFTEKELIKYWQEFAEEKRKEGKQQEYLVLSQQPQLVNERTLQIKLNSSVQIDTVDGLKSDLMPFLRDRLKNDGLTLEAELEMDDTKPLIYTPAEKFKYLAEKHPALKVLQDKLGLDPDF